MAAFKNKDNGTWYVQFRYTDWKGERQQKLKRGFATKREALEWEREFLMEKQADVNMTFESFVALYEKDIKPKLKLNTWLTKESIIKKKILPYFANRKLSEITAKDIIRWQNEIRELRDYHGKPLSKTYLKTVHNQLSAIFNHAARFYGLNINPARQAGNMGAEERKEICVLTVHHTRKQQADDSFETISGTTGLLGCADGSLLMQKKKRTELDATIKVVGRDQPDQILYLKKDPQTQIWNLERMEKELYKEPPDLVLDAVAKLVSAECREWIGSPSELVEAIQTGMASNALTKYLNVKVGRLLEEYHVGYENKAKHSGRQVKLTYMLVESTACEVTEE